MRLKFSKCLDTGMELFDSETDSDVQLVFLTGGLSPGIWNYQLRYFSNDYRVLCFKNDEGLLQSELSKLEKLFEQKDLDNVVIFSFWTGNITSKNLDRFDEKILGRVLVGDEYNLQEQYKPKYKSIVKYFNRFKHPKIVKELFFGDNPDYRSVKRFSDIIDFSNFESYFELETEESDFDSLRITGSEDRFSTLSLSSGFREISSSGSFPYFEKPEEFNEVCLNYINFLDRVRKESMSEEVEERNVSLMDYSGKKKSEKADKGLRKIAKKQD